MKLSQEDYSSLALDNATDGQEFDVNNLALDVPNKEVKEALLNNGATVPLVITSIKAQLAQSTSNPMLVVSMMVQLDEDSNLVIPPITEYLSLPLKNDPPFTAHKKRASLEGFLKCIGLTLSEFFVDYAPSFPNIDMTTYIDRVVVVKVSRQLAQGRMVNKVLNWVGPYQEE